jgi:hypothetical protein
VVQPFCQSTYSSMWIDTCVGSYPVHKGHAVHKYTKRNMTVHFPSNDMTARGVFHKTDSASYGGCGRVHLQIYDGRWMGDGRPGFVLCICARRDPCALDTIPTCVV